MANRETADIKQKTSIASLNDIQRSGEGRQPWMWQDSRLAEVVSNLPAIYNN